MWENLDLGEIVEITKDPYPWIRKWKLEKGVPIIGTIFADLPEEIIYAFDFLPLTMIGTYRPLKKAPGLLPDNACSLARSNLELVLSYEDDLFDGYVLPQVCDTTQHLSDIWRINTMGKYFESFLVPRQLDRESARYWMKKEIERLIESMENYSKKSLKMEKLKEAIKIHNENKRLLMELYEIKRTFPLSLTNRQLFSMIKLSMQVDKEEFNKSLRRIKEVLRVKEDVPFARVILTGIVSEPLEILDLLDEINVAVVADTLVTGSRYLQGIVDEDRDPLEALTERHFKRGFFSPIHRDVFENFKELKNLYEKMKPDAIIFTHTEFCESEEYDIPDLKIMMKEKGIPLYVVETEFQTTSLSRERTRLQAFFESLRGGR